MTSGLSTRSGGRIAPADHPGAMVAVRGLHGWRSSRRWACRPGPSSTPTARAGSWADRRATSGTKVTRSWSLRSRPSAAVARTAGSVRWWKGRTRAGLVRASQPAVLRPSIVGYIAHQHILGLSKLTRLVRLFARRFSVQERIGQQLADALERYPFRTDSCASGGGASVHANARCPGDRVGVPAPPTGATTTTPTRTLRAEFIGQCGLHG